jgi:hypothetical protein
VLGSHKVLRRLAPVVLVVLFMASLAAARLGPAYAALATAQVGFYGLAALGGLLRRAGAGRSRLLYAPFFFVLANTAALVALYRILRGHRIESWQPHRPQESTIRG